MVFDFNNVQVKIILKKKTESGYFEQFYDAIMCSVKRTWYVKLFSTQIPFSHECSMNVRYGRYSSHAHCPCDGKLFISDQAGLVLFRFTFISSFYSFGFSLQYFCAAYGKAIRKSARLIEKVSSTLERCKYEDVSSIWKTSNMCNRILTRPSLKGLHTIDHHFWMKKETP